MSISNDDAAEILALIESEAYIPADLTGVSDLRVVDLSDVRRIISNQTELGL